MNLKVADSNGMIPFLLAVATGVIKLLFDQLDAVPEEHQRALFRGKHLA